jgi:hypothetical protein
VADDLTDTIRENAEGPEEASANGVHVKRHGLQDQIEADKYLAGKDAVQKNPAKAFVRVKMVQPGTV